MANVTFVQANQAASATASVSCAYISNTTTGSYLLAWIQLVFAPATITSFSDTAGNSWVQIGSSVTSIGEVWILYQCLSSLGGANTVTVAAHFAGEPGINIGIAEYTGQSSTPLQASTPFIINTSVSSFSSSAVVTTQNGEQLIFLGWTNAHTDPAITAGAGYTVQFADSSVAGAFLLDSASVAATPGTYNCSFTASATTALGGYLIAITNASVAFAPTFNPGSGNYPLNQSITIASITPTGTIYYTTDGTIPTHGSSSISNGSSITATVSETVKALASVATFSDSAVSTAVYTIAGPLAATPTFNPSSGIYFSSQIVTVSSTTPGGAIYYTIDGTTPTTSSAIIANGGTVTISATSVLQAIEVAVGFSNSLVGSASYTITTMPTANSQFQFLPVSGTSDMLQFKNAGGTVLSWIDHTGTGQGNLKSTGGGGGGGGGTTTAILPTFGRYTLSVNNVGVVSAQNNITGNVDYSGSDAAVVVTSVLTALSTTGGSLFFQEGIYNINSMTQETASGWTMFFYGIGIPSNALGSNVQFIFEGSSRVWWEGELGSSTIQSNGVIFNVTTSALAGISGTDIACAFWQRPLPGASIYFQECNDVFFKNVSARFPTNQTTNLIAFCMYNTSNIGYENCNADFNLSYATIAAGSLPAAGTIGFTSSTSGAGNWQHFVNTYATGYYYGYDIQSEHLYGDTITSLYCRYAGIIGRGKTSGWPSLFPTIYHPTFMVHPVDQECANGWQLGANLANGSIVTILNYDIESLASGTFARSANMSESNSGYSGGYISWTNLGTPSAAYQTSALFASGGINFVIFCGSNNNFQGLKVLGATPTVSSGQLGVGSSTGFGNGSSGTAVTTTTKSTGTGPATPQTVVGYLEVNLGGTAIWIPYVQ